mmetsp:Transcript_3607/g.10376  ORF Transcript_3607/g.10376 Transcript_3607/m.10376 type:complete len:271 (+) Transcript_3607:2199-3011(+)
MLLPLLFEGIQELIYLCPQLGTAFFCPLGFLQQRGAVVAPILGGLSAVAAAAACCARGHLVVKANVLLHCPLQLPVLLCQSLLQLVALKDSLLQAPFHICKLNSGTAIKSSKGEECNKQRQTSSQNPTVQITPRCGAEALPKGFSSPHFCLQSACRLQGLAAPRAPFLLCCLCHLTTHPLHPLTQLLPLLLQAGQLLQRIHSIVVKFLLEPLQHLVAVFHILCELIHLILQVLQEALLLLPLPGCRSCYRSGRASNGRPSQCGTVHLALK